MRNLRQPVAGITLQHDPVGLGSWGPIVNSSDLADFNAQGMKDVHEILYRKFVYGAFLMSIRPGGVSPWRLSGGIRYSAAERARSQAYVDASDKVNNPQPPAETGGGGSSQSYPYETRDFVIRDAGDAAVAAAASAQNGMAKERGDVVGAVVGAYVKAAGWVQDRIDYAGESYWGEIPWQNFKQGVKDVWDNPWFQGGVLALSFITPWPGDEMAAAGWVGSKSGKTAYTLFKDLKKILGLDRHHLIEKRLAYILDVLSDNIPSVHLPKHVHKEITQLWRKNLPYKNSGKPVTTSNATVDDVINAARNVYKNYPEYWKQVEQWLRDIGKLQ